MSKFILLSLLSIAFIIFVTPFGIKAQNDLPDSGDQTDRTARPNLLRELDLTPAQIQQIRRINKERRQVTQESQQRLKAANQALDEAIYANAGDSEIQARQKDVQLAHSEFVKNRTINEQAIKQVLTQQQFERFRNLQTQYKQNKQQNKVLNPSQNNGENTLNNRQNINQNKQNNTQNKPLNLRQQMRQNRLERRAARKAQRNQ